jgi:hypothetical protein
VGVFQLCPATRSDFHPVPGDLANIDEAVDPTGEGFHRFAARRVVQRHFVSVKIDEVFPGNHAEIKGDAGDIRIRLCRHNRITFRGLRSSDRDARAARMPGCRCRSSASEYKEDQSGQQEGEPDQWAGVKHTSSVVLWTV